MDLVDHEIDARVKLGILIIDPYSVDSLQPNSYDVHLLDEYVLYTNRAENGALLPVLPPLDITDPNIQSMLEEKGYRKTIKAPYIDVYPGECVLGSTIEVITLPDNIRATVNGKSSLARYFLLAHQTGGFVDAGFSGQITLEITNNFTHPIRLKAGMPVAQLDFVETSRCNTPYNMRKGSKYCGQMGPTASLYHRNF